jgi:hypothetical protein
MMLSLAAACLIFFESVSAQDARTAAILRIVFGHLAKNAFKHPSRSSDQSSDIRSSLL